MLASQPTGGLLGPTPFSLASIRPPPPANAIPKEMRLSGHLRLGKRSTAEAAAPDLFDEDNAPLELQPYLAGLQPTIAPAGVEWQEEVIFDRIARTDREIEATMHSYLEAARSYDTALSEHRVRAAQYYRGEKLGDEEPGRSQIVLTTVRDTIRATLPSLLRIFTAVENPVEFVPTVADNEQLGLLHAELARQATSYAHWGLFTANQGWVILHDILLNALTYRVGWAAWSWGQQRASRVEECERMLQPQLQALLLEPGITAQRITRRPMLPSEQRAIASTPEGAAYLQAGGPPVLYGARITRVAARAWPIVESCPPGSIWIVADADQVGSARAIFRVRDVPASDLTAAGLPRQAIEDAAGEPMSPIERREAIARDPVSGRAMQTDRTGGDKAARTVRYTEGWIQTDTDDDGVTELIHTHALGSSARLCRWDRTDEIPLAAFVPYREPGRVIGYSQADMVMDLQRTETRVMRATLDALGQAIFPRTVVTIGQVTMEDVRQTAIGSIIRATQPGAVSELTKPFIGDAALAVMAQLEAVREGRTGITRTSQGLTAAELQSTTPAAVDAQTGAAHDRIDMIARTLAETGLTQLYIGLLKMMARHQDRPNVLSIRGKWISVDPRALSTMWDVQVNIGGRGTPQERLAMLNAIAAKQEQILAPAVQQGMLDTPLVGLPNYRNTLARMCETAGISDVVTYFKELPPDWQPPPPPPPQPSTDQVLAQVESQKTQAGIYDDARDSQTERIKLLLEDDRSRSEAAVNAWVTAYATAAKGGLPLPSIDDFKSEMAATVPAARLFSQPPPLPQPQQPIPAPGTPVPPALGAPPGPMPGRPMPAGPPGAVPSGGAAPMPGGVMRGRPTMPGGPPAAPADPASLLAMRQAMTSGRPDVAAGILRARGLAGS